MQSLTSKDKPCDFFFLEQVFTEPELNKQAAKSRSYKAFWIHYTQKRQKRFTVPRHPISSSHFPGLLAYYRCEETAKYRAFEHDWRTAWFRTTIKEIQAKEDPCLFLTIRTDRQPHVKIRITHLDDDKKSLNYTSMEKNLSEPPKLCQISCWPLDPVVVVTFRTNCYPVWYILVYLQLFVYTLHRQGLASISSYQLLRGGWGFNESVRADMKSSEVKKAGLWLVQKQVTSTWTR